MENHEMSIDKCVNCRLANVNIVKGTDEQLGIVTKRNELVITCTALDKHIILPFSGEGCPLLEHKKNEEEVKNKL
jgi:hypothetical protein